LHFECSGRYGDVGVTHIPAVDRAFSDGSRKTCLPGPRSYYGEEVGRSRCCPFDQRLALA
jgi:hypothetical protein